MAILNAKEKTNTTVSKYSRLTEQTNQPPGWNPRWQAF